MRQICVVALRALAATAIAFTLLPTAAHARDSSLCAPRDPAALAATARIERCLTPPGAEEPATLKPPVVEDNASPATSVIAGPITHARHFIYRVLRPETPSGETIVLLHGSGGDEASLF